MKRLPKISRRDFLGGVALTGLAAGLSPLKALQEGLIGGGTYPPALTGLRGNHPGSFEVAHSLSFGGAKYERPAAAVDAPYDLIIVGAGISGLAAAHLARKELGSAARILILDNHDDFGGHAKRNEFTVGGKQLIGYGGSQSLDNPKRYSRVSKRYLREIGVRPRDFYDHYDQDFFERHGLASAIHLDAATYGEDQLLVRDRGDRAWGIWGYEDEAGYANLAQTLAALPLEAGDKAKLSRLLLEHPDWLEGRSRREKIAYLRETPFEECLRRHVGLSDAALALFRNDFVGLWALGWDALSGLEAVRLWHPGTYGLGIDGDRVPDAYEGDEPYIFHFPDGNAGVARLALATLVPDAVSAGGMEGIVRARIAYDRLDRAANPVRVRLSSTVVDARNSAEGGVEITYVRASGEVERVTAPHAVMACYNHMLPHIMPEMPATQVEALNWAEKVPLAYASVALTNWRAFADAGAGYVYAPGGLFGNFSIDFPVSMGGYKFAASPDEPVVVHMTHCPTRPGLHPRQQHQLGRHDMLAMTFDDYETAIVGQLTGALGGHGFDAARDIAAITVNRWPHGYTYEYNELYDGDFSRENGPHIAGRARVGNISIANSDAVAYAYVDGAIDAAARSIEELYG